jgi:hypothetical protein
VAILGTAAAGQSVLARWGDVFSIIAGVVAVGLVLWAVGLWLRRRLTTEDLAHGLDVTPAQAKIGIPGNHLQAIQGLGIVIYSAKDFPIRYEIESFNVTIGQTYKNSYTGHYGEVVLRGRDVTFVVDTVEPGMPMLPIVVGVTYSLRYGRHDEKKARRRLVGNYSMQVDPVITPGTVPTVWRKDRPEDGRIPRKQRTAWHG